MGGEKGWVKSCGDSDEQHGHRHDQKGKARAPQATAVAPGSGRGRPVNLERSDERRGDSCDRSEFLWEKETKDEGNRDS